MDLDDLKRVDEKYPDSEQSKEPVLPELPPTEDADTNKKTGKGDNGKGTSTPSKPTTSTAAAPEPEPEDAFAALQRRFAELKKR